MVFKLVTTYFYDTWSRFFRHVIFCLPGDGRNTHIFHSHDGDVGHATRPPPILGAFGESQPKPLDVPSGLSTAILTPKLGLDPTLTPFSRQLLGVGI